MSSLEGRLKAVNDFAAEYQRRLDQMAKLNLWISTPQSDMERILGEAKKTATHIVVPDFISDAKRIFDEAQKSMQISAKQHGAVGVEMFNMLEKLDGYRVASKFIKQLEVFKIDASRYVDANNFFIAINDVVAIDDVLAEVLDHAIESSLEDATVNQERPAPLSGHSLESLTAILSLLVACLSLIAQIYSMVDGTATDEQNLGCFAT
jgi:hypothetical protein